LPYNLTPDQLDLAVAALAHHGQGSFFPESPELAVVNANWALVRDRLAKLDLDAYTGYPPLWIFAPKSRLSVRRVPLLHPFDLIIYTSLVLELRDYISASRLPPEENRVFSFRAEGAPPHLLWNPSPSYKDFREQSADRLSWIDRSFVGTADIADFYPRIYQHRLVNALEAASGPAKHDCVRVLEKLLLRFSAGASYGIPVGPVASRPLGEAVLVDVDSTLMSYEIDFVRFVDDFAIFADTPEDAEYGIRVLGETLFTNHGLTLQAAKTKVVPLREYYDRHLKGHSEKEAARRTLLNIFGSSYEVVAYEHLRDEQRAEVDALNLSEMLQEALSEGDNVDFNEVSFILGRLSALQKPELIPIVLDHLPRLFPVAHSVASFFKGFQALDKQTRETVAEALLDPLLGKGSRQLPEYYSMWVLSVFQHSAEWDHAEQILRVFRESNSDAIRRFAALALAKSGARPQVLALKGYVSTASPLCRTAILLATAKLGPDERKYLRQSLQLSDPLERLCAQSQL